jgi:hypothetical protein
MDNNSMTKQFKEYLSESAKKYDFRIKVAGGLNDEQAKTMEALLAKFQVSSFKKVGNTPIQELPLDFPKIKNAEVGIYETQLDYPATQWELHEYLCNSMSITKDAMVVRRPGENSETYQEPQEPRTEALLTDSEYKEAPNANFEDYYGDKYNTGFVKELNDILKLQRKERGEVIPEAKADEVSKNPGKTTNEIPQYENSPIKQSDYNPKA